MTDFFYGIGNLSYKFFHVMEKLENNFNFTIIVILAIAFVVWLGWQQKFNKEAEKNGTLK